MDRVREIVSLLGCVGRESEVAELGMFEAMFSNRHHRNVLISTLGYPQFLVLSLLREREVVTREDIASLDGIDTEKLSVGSIVRHLERLGFCEEENGSVRLLRRDWHE